MDIRRCGDRLCHREVAVGRELGRARTVGKRHAVCIADICIEPCIRRHIGEAVVIDALVRKADLVAADRAKAADLLAERQRIEVDGIGGVDVGRLLCPLADDHTVLRCRVGLHKGKSAGCGVIALVSMVADPALSVGIGHIGGVAAARELFGLCEDRGGVLLPAAHQERIAADILQLTELIGLRPIAAARINDENGAVLAVDSRRAFDDLRVNLVLGADLLPVVVRAADDLRLATDAPGLVKLGDVDGLIEVDVLRAAGLATDFADEHDVLLVIDIDDRAAAAQLIHIEVAVRELDLLRDIRLAGQGVAPAAEQVVAVQALDDIRALAAEAAAGLLAVAAVTAEEAVPARVRRADIRCAEVVDLGRPKVLRPLLACLGGVDHRAGGGGKVADVGCLVNGKSGTCSCNIVVEAVMEEQPRVCAVGTDRVLEGHRAGDLCVKIHMAAGGERARHRRVCELCRAGECRQMCEVAVRDADIVAARIAAERGVGRNGNHRVELAAADGQRDIARNGLLRRGNVKDIDACKELAAVNRRVDLALVVARRGEDELLLEGTALNRELSGKVAVARTRRTAAHALPGAALDGEIGAVRLLRIGRHNAGVGAAHDAGSRGDRAARGALQSIAEDDGIQHAVETDIRLLRLNFEIFKQGFATAIVVGFQNELRAVLAIVHAVVNRGDGDFLGVTQPGERRVQRVLAADDQHAAVLQRFIRLGDAAARRRCARAAARAAVLQVEDLFAADGEERRRIAEDACVHLRLVQRQAAAHVLACGLKCADLAAVEDKLQLLCNIVQDNLADFAVGDGQDEVIQLCIGGLDRADFAACKLDARRGRTARDGINRCARHNQGELAGRRDLAEVARVELCRADYIRLACNLRCRIDNELASRRVKDSACRRDGNFVKHGFARQRVGAGKRQLCIVCRLQRDRCGMRRLGEVRKRDIVTENDIAAGLCRNGKGIGKGSCRALAHTVAGTVCGRIDARLVLDDIKGCAERRDLIRRIVVTVVDQRLLQICLLCQRGNGIVLISDAAVYNLRTRDGDGGCADDIVDVEVLNRAAGERNRGVAVQAARDIAAGAELVDFAAGHRDDGILADLVGQRAAEQRVDLAARNVDVGGVVIGYTLLTGAFLPRTARDDIVFAALDGDVGVQRDIRRVGRALIAADDIDALRRPCLIGKRVDRDTLAERDGVEVGNHDERIGALDGDILKGGLAVQHIAQRRAEDQLRALCAVVHLIVLCRDGKRHVVCHLVYRLREDIFICDDNCAARASHEVAGAGKGLDCLVCASAVVCVNAGLGIDIIVDCLLVLRSADKQRERKERADSQQNRQQAQAFSFGEITHNHSSVSGCTYSIYHIPLGIPMQKCKIFFSIFVQNPGLA